MEEILKESLKNLTDEGLVELLSRVVLENHHRMEVDQINSKITMSYNGVLFSISIDSKFEVIGKDK